MPKTLVANKEHDRLQNFINANTIFDHNSSNALNKSVDELSQDPIEDILPYLQLHKRSIASDISSNKNDTSNTDKSIDKR